jgi:phage-related protein
LLRVYIVYCQHSYILIHQFNKKKNDITGIQVVPS